MCTDVFIRKDTDADHCTSLSPYSLKTEQTAYNDHQSASTSSNSPETRPLDEDIQRDPFEKLPNPTAQSSACTSSAQSSVPPTTSVYQSCTLPRREEKPHPTRSTSMENDSDNDYIEPESPTGADALIYDDDDNNDDSSNHVATESEPSTKSPPTVQAKEQASVHSPSLDYYNPSNVQAQTCTT